MLFLWCKAEFSSSLLQFSVSHDLLEIINLFDSQETFLIIINVKNNFAASYFVWKWWCTIFQDFLINIKFNEQHLFACIKYINLIC